MEVPTVDALQFIEFETQFEPVDKKIANINIMNEDKKLIIKDWRTRWQRNSIAMVAHTSILWNKSCHQCSTLIPSTTQSNDVNKSLAQCLSIYKEVISMKHSSS